MIIRTKPGAESKKGSAAEGLQELKSAFLKSREQTERLERVIRLCETARAASDRRALGYTALNDTLAAIDYRQAALWWRAADDAGAGRIEGLSGVADPVRNAAFPAWLVKRLGGFADAHPAGASSLSGSALADELVQPFNVLEHPPAADHDRMMAKEFLPAQALWAELPLKAPQAGGAGIRAALILWRDAPWTGADKAILTHLARAYADAWSAMPLGRSDWSGEGTVKAHSGRLLVWSRKRWVRCAAAAAVVGAMLIPIRQSVLAPAEVTAKNPFAVRAPLSGVVEEIVVKPNAPVKAGDLLVRMDSRDLRGQLEAARQTLSVAEAEYRQGQQQAFFDERSKMALGVLKRRRDQAEADAAFLAGELERTEIRADRSGVAVFSDPQEWLGRPVAVGERILMVADPRAVELEAEIPVGDAVALEKGAEVKFFLNASPTSPLEAELTRVAYRASATADGTLAYKARAEFVLTDGDAPQLGLKGTAKFYGEETFLGLYLLRRPLATLRLWLGV